jgi:hypothetical protein
MFMGVFLDAVARRVHSVAAAERQAHGNPFLFEPARMNVGELLFVSRD